MPPAQLFMAPGTCARVSAICLEEAGVAFETQLVRLMKGEHKSPAFKAHNPKGKVPALVIDGHTLTENLAIIHYLNETHPSAKLLPSATTPIERALVLADLSFCASTLHPIVSRIRMPQLYGGPEAARAVWEKGCAAMTEYFALVEDRLANQAWWAGDEWSAIDAYLYWVFWRVEGAEFDVSNVPAFTAHARAMEQRPAVQRALAREDAAIKQLEAEGVSFKPPPVPG